MGNLKNLLLKLRQIGIKRKLPTLAHGADLLAQIEINCLRESGIKGIILDLDDTIISEDDQYIYLRVQRIGLHRQNLQGCICLFSQMGNDIIELNIGFIV